MTFNQITRSITQDSELTSMDKILPLAKKLLKKLIMKATPSALSDYPYLIQKKKKKK